MQLAGGFFYILIPLSVKNLKTKFTTGANPKRILETCCANWGSGCQPKAVIPTQTIVNKLNQNVLEA